MAQGLFSQSIRTTSKKTTDYHIENISAITRILNKVFETGPKN